MPAPLNISGPCEICGQKAHGNHFGVLSCRACAAFFRRAGRIKSKSQDIICEKGNCTVSESGIFHCKGCRLKRCYEAGMDSSKFQTDRDLLSSSLQPYSKQGKLSSPQSLANFLGRPELILLCEPDKACTSSSKFIVDVSFLIDKALKVFQEPSSLPSPCNFENSLERMTFALEDMRIAQANQKLEFQTKVGQMELFSFWQDSFVKAAQWFSKFPEFTQFPVDVKLTILKSTWLMWIRLEQHNTTANFRRKKLLGEDVYISGEGRCMNMKNMEIDLSFCTNYSMDQIRPTMESDIDRTWKPCVDALVKLEPTSVELNFMLIQLCLNDAQKRFNGEIRAAIEHLLAIQADNLHDYYTRKMKTPNYSGRLTRMMKVIQYIETDTRSQRERMHLIKTFDIFNMDFSHPEMFEIF